MVQPSSYRTHDARHRMSLKPQASGMRLDPDLLLIAYSFRLIANCLLLIANCLSLIAGR